MPQGAGLAAAVQGTLRVQPDPPPLEVVRGGQGLGAGPDRPPHDAPWHPVYEGLPADVCLLLSHQGQQLTLKGHLGGLLLSLPPEDTSHLGLGSFQYLGLLNPEGGLVGGAVGGGGDEALVLGLHLLKDVLTLHSSAGFVGPLALPLHCAPECLLGVEVGHEGRVNEGRDVSLQVDLGHQLGAQEGGGEFIYTLKTVNTGTIIATFTNVTTVTSVTTVPI